MSALYLDTPTLEDMLTDLEWRKTCPESLRTTHLITPYEQTNFYHTVIANGQAPHRYYAVRDGAACVAVVSLEYIQWENRYAEIGLIVDPRRQRQGIGYQAVDLILEKAFDCMGLKTVWGEVYEVNPSLQFWVRVCERYHGFMTKWPRRKFWHGRLYDAVLFSIAQEGWEASRCSPESSRDSAKSLAPSV